MTSQRKLRRTIAECQKNKRTIHERVTAIRREGQRRNLSPKAIEQKITNYLGEKTYREWMHMYDTIIRNAEEHLSPSRMSPLAAAALLLLLIGGVLFFPLDSPTGNLLGLFQDPGKALLTKESRSGVDHVAIRGSDGSFEPIDEQELTGQQDITLTYDNGELLLEEISLDEQIDIQLRESAAQIENEAAIAAYTVEGAAIQSSAATFRNRARGRQLWRCSPTPDCDWEYLRELEPGEEYEEEILDNTLFAETDLIILNVQSYPIVGGNWQVDFTTVGTADLSIKASNGTTWSETEDTEDLRFLEIRCGEQVLPYEWRDGGIFIPNYSCSETSHERSRVLTKGKHFINFTFGNNTHYARNLAAATGILMLRDAAGDQDVNFVDTAGGVNFTWDTQDRVDSVYAHNAGTDNITINTAGIYRVSYGIAVNRTTANTRVEHYGNVLVDGQIQPVCLGATYTRGRTQEDHLRSVVSSDCLLNLTAGQEVVLNTGRSSTSSVPTESTANRSWFHMQLLPNPTIALIRDQGGGQSMGSATGTLLDWDTAEYIGSAFSFTPGESNVTILENGLYRITYGVGVNLAASIRYGGYVEMSVNGQEQHEGLSHTYIRATTGADDGVITADLLIELNASDNISFTGYQESNDPEAAVTVGNRTWLQLEQLNPGDTNVITLREEGGGQDINNVNGVDIDFDTLGRNDSDFDQTDSNTIEVQRTGLYRLVYSVYTDRSTVSGVRLGTFGRVRVDGSDENVCWSGGYLRGSQGGDDSYETTNFASCLLNLTAGQDLEVQIGRDTSSSITAATSNGTWWYMQSLDVINEPPTIINLTHPANNSNVTTATVDFNFTAADDQNSMNCTLYTNITGSWAANTTVTGVQNDTETNITIQPPDGTFHWNILCVDEYNLSSFFTGNYTVTVDANPPTISNPTLNVTTLNQSHSLHLNVTVTDVHAVSSVTAKLRYPNGTNATFPLTQVTSTIWRLNFSDTNTTGIHNFTNIIAEDIYGNSNNQSFTNVTFNVTSSPPSQFNLLLPLNNTASTNLQPNMSWEQSSDEHFANYTLRIDTSPTFPSPDFTYNTTNVTNTSILLPVPLVTDTLYYWQVTATDIFDNKRNSTDTFIYITDTTDPQVTLNWPTNNSYVTTATFDFNYTINETNIANCSLWGNFSGSWALNQTNLTPTNLQDNYFTSTLPDGQYLWNVQCFDRAGNSDFAPANYTMIVDTTPPVVNLESPANNTFENITNNIDFLYNVTDAGTTIDNCILIIDGNQSGNPDDSVTEGISQNFTAFVANGQHNWSINCTDTNGFTGSSPTYNLTVNVTFEADPPVITLNYPPAGAYLDTNNISFNYTPADATGIANCSLYINATLNQTDTTVEANVPNYFNVSNFSQTLHTWHIFCFDNNTFANATSATRNFTVDLINPTVTLHTPNNATFSTSSTVLFNYTPVDVNLNNCSLWGNFSGTFALDIVNTSPISGQPNNFTRTLDDGEYFWNVQCFDLAARNTFAPANYTLYVDANPPNMTNVSVLPTSPVVFNPTESHQFNITVLDSFIHTVLIEHNFTGTRTNYTLTDTIGAIYRYNYSTLGVGTYTYKWYANDTLGRLSNTTTFTYIVTQNTSTVNLLLNGTDGNFSIIQGESVNITGLLTNPSSGTITLYLDGSLLAQGSSPLTNISTFPDPGTYNVTLIYNATQNYTGSSETHFIMVNDTILPNVSLIFPDNATTIGNPDITFQYNVTDASTIANCSLYISGAINLTDTSITRDIVQTFNTNFPDGNYTWQVRCTDSWGNIGLSKIRNFTVFETTAILINLTTDMPSYQTGEYVNFTTNTTDEFGNALNSTVVMDIIYANTTAAWWNISWPYRIPLLANNSRNFNKSETATINVTGLDSNVSNCTSGLRVVDATTVSQQSIPFEALNGDNATWCLIRFNVNITAETTNEQNYHIYYGNLTAHDPGHTLTQINPRVLRDYITSSSTSITDSISQVDTSQAFLLFSSLSGSTLPDGSMFTGTLSSTQVRFDRYSSSTGAISYEVVEHPDIEVQQGSETFTSAQVLRNVSISAVNLSESFIVVSSRSDDTTAGDQHDGWFTARFINETAIQLERDASGSNAAVSWQVVEWHGASVQNGSSTLTGTTDDVAISNVDTTRSFVIFSRRMDAAATGLNDQYVFSQLSAANVHMERNAADGTVENEFFVVELPAGSSTQMNSTFINNAITTNTGIDTVNMSRSFTTFGWENTGNGQTETNAYTTINLSSPSQLTFTRQTTGQDATVLSYVVEMTMLQSNFSIGESEYFMLRNQSETGLTGLWSWSWNTDFYPLGNYSAISVASASGFDSNADYAHFNITPDITPPTITLLAPANQSTTTTTVTFTYLPFDYNLQNCTLYHNGSGAFLPIETNLTPTNNANNTFTDYFVGGTYLWNVQCFDESGNSAFASANFTFDVDTVGPTITLLTPDNAIHSSSTTQNLSYNATDPSGLDSCSLYLNGSLNQTDTAPTAGNDSFLVTGLGEGTYTWLVGCTDLLGYSSNSTAKEFTIDTTPPVAFSLLTPANATITTNLTPTFTWEEVTELNFWNYTLQVSLSPTFAPSLTMEYTTFTQNDTSRTTLPLAMDATFYWRVFARDRAGQERESTETFTYITDNSSPTVLLISPPSGDNDPDGNVTLRYQANDNAITNCTLYTNISGTWAPNQTDTNVTPYQHKTFSLFNLPTGINFTFIWNVECFDSLGNGDFAAANRSIRIGFFNETQGNQTIPTNATVNNSRPFTVNVTLAPSIDLIANGLQNVTCNATIEDNNGATEILGANATLHHSSVSASSPDNNSNHYTNASCGACSVLNATAAFCQCNFTVEYYANPGNWTCTVTGSDLGGSGTAGTGLTLINQLQALDVSPTLIDYGTVQGGTPSPEQNVTITNLGNVPINLSVWAYAVTPGDNLSMSCLNGANISISGERFSTAQGTAFNAMTIVGGSQATAATAALNLPKRTGATNSTLPLYWRIQSGSGALGSCNGTVVLHAGVIS